jgi:outer membrane cobalamin receptor
MQRYLCRIAILMTLAIAILCLFTEPVALLAQINTSKIEGTVSDKDSGMPMVGVQVTVEGSNRGNVTNADGYYFILNVPPGRRSITFSFTGYQKTTVADQLLLAGQTTTVDAGLSSTVIELEGITIQGETEIMSIRDNTTTKHRLTAEDATNIPATRLEDLLVIQAGVQLGGRGSLGRMLQIRGGRLGEEAVVVDGVMVRNYTADPFKPNQTWGTEYEVGLGGEDSSPLEFSTGAIEEVDIITGGFQAEYGNAQSGVVNIVTREGGNRHAGNIRYTTDKPMPETADYGYNQIQTSIGGPVGLLSDLYYQFSAELQGWEDRSPTHADEGFRGVNQDFVNRLNDAVANDPVLGGGSEPAYTLDMLKTGKEFYASKMGGSSELFMPENPVRLPLNWRDRTLGAGKLTYSPTPRLKFLGSANLSRTQQTYPAGLLRGEGNYFHDGIATYSELPERNWEAQAPDTIMYSTPSFGRRSKTFNYLFGFDWDFYRTPVRNASLQFRFSNMRNQDINDASLKMNYERDSFLGWQWHEMPFEMESYPNRDLPAIPDLQHLWFPDGRTSYRNDWMYETPFKMQRDAYIYKVQYSYLYEKQNTYKVDLDFQLNRLNRAKAGFQFTDFSNHVFVTASDQPMRNLMNEFIYSPRMYAFYAQNRTDIGDFVFDYGIRYDRFEPVDNWGLKTGDMFEEKYFPKNLSTVSPRFDAAFPVTDRTQLRFSYGTFTQLPSLQRIFNGYNVGNLEFAKTNAFELGLSHLLSDDIAIDFVGYYRDVEGNVAQKDYFRDYYEWHNEKRYRTMVYGYTNGDNGNIKGMDLTVKKMFSRNFSFNATYTLQFSRTTGSDYTAGRSFSLDLVDVTTGEVLTPPDEIRPINNDRTHALNLHFNYLFPEDFRVGTLVNRILRDTRVNAVFTLNSGVPIDSRSQSGLGGPIGHGNDYSHLIYRAGSLIGGANYFRGSWYHNLNIRFTKRFSLGGSRRISVFSEIFNLLNHKLDNPYPAGYEYNEYKSITGGIDRNWDDAWNNSLPTMNRFKNDFNADGILSVREAVMGEIAYQVMTETMDKQRWGVARQVRFGLDFNF